MEEKILDLRLIPLWHGPEAGKSLHLSLFNTGPEPLEDFTLCLTGTLWMADPSRIRGGRVEKALSNFLQIRPDRPRLEPGDVWNFVLSGLNEPPRRAGDGPKSAYVAFDGGALASVAVQPLTRSRGLLEPEAGKPDEAAPDPDVAAPSRISICVVPFPNMASVSVAPLAGEAPALEWAPETPEPQRRICEAVAALAARMAPEEPPVFAAPGEVGQRRILLKTVTDSRLGAEGYRLVFQDAEIRLEAAGEAGLCYGLITLAQMALGARRFPQRFGFPTRGAVTDTPRFGWRGAHLDVARTFYPMAEVKAFADLCVWLKLNLLHLHLTDDEGWRLEVEGYPEVARHAAWRGHGLRVPPLLGSSFAPCGGVYSREEIRDLERHAASFGLTVMPEIDLPGHGHALMEALPHLREPGDEGGYHSIQGFFANALNPCLPQTYEFLGAALDSAMAAFSGPFIHIGGDELGPETWSGSPLARRTAAERGLDSTGELQGLLTSWAQERVAAAGRKAALWEDALDYAAPDPASTVVVVWQHPDRAHERAAHGYDVVLAPGNAYYLDMASTEAWDSAGGHWAGATSLQKTYDFEAELGWPADLPGRLLGVQACVWGEHMLDRRNFEALVFPRLLAFAERAWIDRSAKDYAGFLRRSRASLALLKRGEGCA